MHPIDNSSVLPSPASPTTSFQGQQQLLSSRSLLNSNSIRGQSPPFSSTPAVNGYSNILDAPMGITYREFIRTWSDTHVACWLSDIKCGSQASRFKENDIRGDVLLELDQVTLKEMGVASIGDRLRILNAIKSLRQKCSSKPVAVPIPAVDRGHSKSIDGRSSSASDNSGTISSRSGHERSASENSMGVRLSSRRLDAGRPAPLQLNSSRANDLPRILRDGAGPDSARPVPSSRPLPQPQSTPGSSATPTSNNSSQSSSSIRSGLPYVPPVPRSYPPNPPPSRAPPRAPLNGPSLNGRRTPTQNDIPSYANQPLPPAPQNQNLLTPGTANSNWAGYGLPSDPRPGNPGGKTPVRATSPLNLQPRGSRFNNNTTHVRNTSLSPPNSTSSKPGSRPSTATNAHPYAAAQGPGLLPAAQQAYNLSPIAESFISTSGSPPPPALPYAAGRGPSNRPNTPSHSNVLSLDDLRRKLVKFLLPDERHSCTINVADCAGGVEVLEKVLKKMGKTASLGSDADGTAGHIQLSEGGLIVDGWGVFLDLPNSERAGELSTPIILKITIYSNDISQMSL
jgi:mitogen-activated protein kinase kinase kinase